NQAERVIRPIVIGRKNWLFVGSDDATAWAARNHTLFESCRLAQVEPRAYLRHVIASLHAGGVDPATLTPECAPADSPRRAETTAGARQRRHRTLTLGRASV
nr:transposase [Planctomycetota bacterium]